MLPLRAWVAHSRTTAAGTEVCDADGTECPMWYSVLKLSNRRCLCNPCQKEVLNSAQWCAHSLA